MTNRTCPACGVSFAAPCGRGRRPTYCSKRCKGSVRSQVVKDRRRDSRRVALETSTCAWCFTRPVKYGRTRYCSAECLHTATSHRASWDTPDRCPVTYWTCRDCGMVGAGYGRAASVRRRCDRCGEAADRDHDRKKRAARRNAVVEGETVRLATVAHRDRWRCQLCGKRVDRERRWPDPLSASLDHVVPLSRGGLHAMSNVQLAHLGCNMRKGDRPAGEQLRLVG